jgi:hypothetical protein
VACSLETARRALGALLVPVALPVTALLVSCAAEVIDVPIAAAPHEVVTVSAEAAAPDTRELGSVSTGGEGARLAYLDGTALVVAHDPEAERQDPFALAFDGDSHGLALPDFSALTRRGYDFTFATGDYLRAPTYATSSRGDVYYFEGFTQGTRYGYAVAHASPGRDAEVFEIPASTAYAFFPSHLVVRGEKDVYVGAATVKNGTFGPDFPGCPISILHGQNGVFLAHIGPSGAHPDRVPGRGPPRHVHGRRRRHAPRDHGLARRRGRPRWRAQRARDLGAHAGRPLVARVEGRRSSCPAYSVKSGPMAHSQESGGSSAREAPSAILAGLREHVPVGVDASHDRRRFGAFVAVHGAEAHHADHLVAPAGHHGAARIPRTYGRFHEERLAGGGADRAALARLAVDGVARGGASSEADGIDLFADARRRVEARKATCGARRAFVRAPARPRPPRRPWRRTGGTRWPSP